MTYFNKIALAAGTLCLAATSAFADNEFNVADQCVIDKSRELIQLHHRTTAEYTVNLNELQDACETETGIKVENQLVLQPERGISVGGTEFIFEYTPKP